MYIKRWSKSGKTDVIQSALYDIFPSFLYSEESNLTTRAIMVEMLDSIPSLQLMLRPYKSDPWSICATCDP